jgi:hypothetical protein
MKKLFLILTIASLSSLVMNAQDIAIGAKAGVNFASIGGDDTDDLDGRTAFHVGAAVEIPISDKFSVQPELLYSAQGATTSEEGIDVDFNADYLNIPVMAKFYVGEGFSIEAGPQLGFLLSAKAKAGSEEEDLKDFVKSTDFGANLGLGYKLESGLHFGARYNLGISNINDGLDSEDFKNQNNVIQVSVGYFFN